MNTPRTPDRRTSVLRRFPVSRAGFPLLVLAVAVLPLVMTTGSEAQVRVAEVVEENDEQGSEPKVQTDPTDGAEMTRPARSLRVWFDRAPVVEESSLTLSGPNGDLQVAGLHTMGEDDLMARVVGPMPDGEYEASYSATFVDGETLSGSWSFRIRRSGQNHR